MNLLPFARALSLSEYNRRLFGNIGWSTMDATSINLTESTVARVVQEGDEVRIRFEPAVLIKTMTGSAERTKWRQNGELIFKGARIEGDLPDLPGTCAGGDVGENVYTYRDMVPVPLESRGRAHCDLKIGEHSIRVEASAVELVLEDTPKYVEHLRPS